MSPYMKYLPFLLSLRRWRNFARNVPSGDQRGETDVFEGYIAVGVWEKFLWV